MLKTIASKMVSKNLETKIRKLNQRQSQNQLSKKPTDPAKLKRVR